jgi:acetyl-CoA carboxylase alpha subunit
MVKPPSSGFCACERQKQYHMAIHKHTPAKQPITIPAISSALIGTGGTGGAPGLQTTQGHGEIK